MCLVWDERLVYYSASKNDLQAFSFLVTIATPLSSVTSLPGWAAMQWRHGATQTTLLLRSGPDLCDSILDDRIGKKFL